MSRLGRGCRTSAFSIESLRVGGMTCPGVVIALLLVGALVGCCACLGGSLFRGGASYDTSENSVCEGG